MIKGLGIDLVRINRIEEMIERWGNSFLQKVFTPGEIEYCNSKSRPAIHFAARFAVKEAVIKMLGGNTAGFKWHDFEVCNNSAGRPELVLSERIEDVIKKAGIETIHISISHEREYAIAQAIGEGDSR
jgi:phosphopantetheine--protein transferase-like protein